MKTESEKLKASKDKQYADQRFEEIKEYMDVLIKRMDETHYWVKRAKKLEGIVMVIHLILVFGLRFAGIDLMTIIFITDWSLILWFLMVIRSLGHYAKWMYAIGEFDGCVKTLEKLGIVNLDTRGGNSRKKYKKESLYKLVKETWERLRLKVKKKTEAYA